MSLKNRAPLCACNHRHALTCGIPQLWTLSATCRAVALTPSIAVQARHSAEGQGSSPHTASAKLQHHNSLASTRGFLPC
eukprot:CAMPEP_0177153530 /NCGR_PEP_ID=MMETSP0367-20130122/1129_1 /TAXON_ID=447022 ORGANISM="Scrippsiella hangoei-like, Strain SHHI-4" /NCGR_SAMPLE_ID=MMETSP0367 /ASSEMBLY_ACC=CAM_ASM_000362 /LENGTH=78 /DNA_ID=CAMNT_0018598697 /DNA_START=42 /DNA_END=275 /DNA_ORIENTATION=+